MPGRLEPGPFKPGRLEPGRFKPGRLEQGRAQPGGIGNVDLFRGRHHRHAPDHLDGEVVLTHLYHLP
jgi:hypothetical protein